MEGCIDGRTDKSTPFALPTAPLHLENGWSTPAHPFLPSTTYSSIRTPGLPTTDFETLFHLRMAEQRQRSPRNELNESNAVGFPFMGGFAGELSCCGPRAGRTPWIQCPLDRFRSPQTQKGNKRDSRCRSCGIPFLASNGC